MRFKKKRHDRIGPRTLVDPEFEVKFSGFDGNKKQKAVLLGNTARKKKKEKKICIYIFS